MSARSFLLLAMAAIIALGTANLVSRRLGDDSRAKLEGEATPRILVAAHDITQGSFVRDAKDFEWVDWPKEMVSESYLVEGKITLEDFNGAVARRSVLKGEPLVASALVKSDEGGFMSAVLQAGKRAVSIAVDSTTGNAGFIFPGDKVDLIVTHSVQVELEGNVRAQEMLASKTFIEGVRVLAVDQKLDNPDNTAILAKTVTLEVSRNQAEKINVAKDMGKISLSLRSLATEEGTASAPLPEHPSHFTRDSDVSPMLHRRLPNGRKVRVYRGSEQEEMEFN